MKDKFKFLVEYGLEKKIKNKLFLIINIVLLVLSICLCNIDRIIKNNVYEKMCILENKRKNI